MYDYTRFSQSITLTFIPPVIVVMAREVESVHTFTHKPHKFAIEKEKTIVRCGDKSTYEFEKTDGMARDDPPRLVRAFQPDGRMTHVTGRKVLPSAVEETVKTLLGRWSK